MKTTRYLAIAAFFMSSVSSFGVMRDTDPRAMALGQAYTALARGPEAVFWNPANLALSGSPNFQWTLAGAGFAIITENNSFSVSTYNDNFTESNGNVSPTRGTKYFISDEDKDDILSDICDNAEVVCYHQNRHAKFVLQTSDQFKYLCLYRYVERGGWFVCY